MHGEFKVQGGKLVVVDLDVVDDRLANITLSGDFFLEPEEALGQMSQALESMPADASVSDYEEAVEKARGNAVMVGFDPRSVVLAVLRALGRPRLPTGGHRKTASGHADGLG